MSKLKFTVGGRELPLSAFGNELRKGLTAQVDETTVKRIEGARCPVHNQSPKNVQVHFEGGKVQWTFEKCCDELERAAAATLR
jgi:hypothetical protein